MADKTFAQHDIYRRGDIAAILRALLSTANQSHDDPYYLRGFVAAIVAVATALHISTSDLHE